MPAVPKPIPRKVERQRKRRAESAWVKTVRAQVVARDRDCRACREMGTTPDRTLPLQMHELLYRSQTRGLPMQERVNTRVSVLLCSRCHRELHEKRLSVHIADVLQGADGTLMFKRWQESV
jgi:hypothetical protein